MGHGDAVFQQGDRAEAVDRHAASADVAGGFTAGGFDPEARHGLQRFGDAGRRLHTQGFFIDCGDRIAGFRLAALAGAAGDDDFDGSVIGRLGAVGHGYGRGGLRLGVLSVGAAGHGQGDKACRDHERGFGVKGHETPHLCCVLSTLY